MAILTGDIKLLASQVMDDVAEGGGAPTATLVTDGASNAIFPDISEVARAGGRVNLRKLHVSVQTPSTDTYMDSNVIVAEPPADPNVSVTLFAGSTFDRRDAAKSRIESYLTKGPVWVGVLLETHVAGQRAIQLLQHPTAELPAVGKTLVLTQDEGLSTEKTQYVRITAVTSSEHLYPNGQNALTPMSAVTCSISDALRYDFTGTPGNWTATAAPGATVVRDTTVADAGTYAGIVPLSQAAAVGDFTARVQNVFTQLVPSAQTETAISDVRTNGLSTALVATGNAVTQSLTLAFTTAQNMFVGGPIYPAILSIVRGSVTLTDSGGLLVTSGGVEVGQVDYDNGIVSLSSNVWGTGGGTHQVTFTPATVPDLISDQRAIRVTIDSRSQSYAFTMGNPPLPRTLSVSYLAQGRWYVLRDNGAGKLAGSSSAYGAGTVSYSTGSVVLTLGALPDVGSSIIIQSYSEVSTVVANNTLLDNGGKVFVPINSDGLISTAKGAKSYTPGTVSIAWNDGTARTATDAGTGVLAGDATGTIDYANGVVLFSPNALPALGTTISVSHDLHTLITAMGIDVTNGNLGATSITPGSVSATLTVNINYHAGGTNLIVANAVRQITASLKDDGAGNLLLDGHPAGTINYATGAIAAVSSFSGFGAYDPAGPAVTYYDPSQYGWPTIWGWDASVDRFFAYRTVSLALTHANVSFANTTGAANTVTVSPTQYMASTLMVPNYTLKGVGFSLGSTRYSQLTDGTLLKDVSPTTGGGTPAGSVAALTGVVTLQSWPTGASPVLTDWRGLIAPPSVGTAAPFSAFSTTFRTATSPLRPSSLSILGTMQDGTAFNVTADSNGKIDGTRVKGQVDVQYGLVELYFVNPAGDVALNVDLSFLQIPGLASVPADLVMLNTLRYNAVAYSYLPLDANILGIDPVRLPSDGRVPIFRSGGFAVVGNTGKITATVSNAQVVDCARVRLSRVRVVGFDGAVINTGYSADLETGLVTFTNVAGYSQPVTIEHRIEDMAVVSDVQISGEVTFTRPLTHAYPITVPPTSFVSSALVHGDLKARVSNLFDQDTWGNVWADALTGNSATGTYNDVLTPITVTNAGALTERWALVFTNTTTFNIIGEHIGVIGTGNINEDQAPLNPTTSAPYFTIPALGWGIGWSAGNVLRFNTTGAMAPVWVVRTIQQGPATGVEHSFTILSRGDVDRP